MEVKVGKSYRVRQNRNTLYGSCGDIKALEGEVVKVEKIYDYPREHVAYCLMDQNGMEHACESCNLEELNNNYISEEV